MRPSRIDVAIAAMIGISLVASGAERSACIVGIDHMPLVVKDLDQSAQTYRRLGFAIKLGRFHQDGIRNQHIKFEDGGGIELITAQKGMDSLSSEYVRLLSQGEGPAFLSFHTQDLRRLKAKLRAGGYEYSDDNGLLTLSNPKLNSIFFFEGNNRSPTDRPEHFTHANTAIATIGVWVADGDDSPLIPLLAALGAEVSKTKVLAPTEAIATVARLQNGDVIFLPTSRRVLRGRSIVGAVFQVRDLAALQRSLATGKVAVTTQVETAGYRSVFIEPRETHGIWLEFRQTE